MSKRTVKESRFFQLAVIISLTLPSAGHAAGFNKDPACGEAIHLELNSSVRVTRDGGEEKLFQLEIPSSGILLIDVVDSIVDGAAPLLSLAEGNCGGSIENDNALVSLERSATHWLLGVRSAGTYLFRMVGKAPGIRPAEFRLRAAFISAELPGGLSEPGLAARRTTVPSLKGGEDEEEIDVDPETSPIIATDVSAEDGSLVVLVDTLCRSGELDDHGDHFLCATYLRPAQTRTGEIRNLWVDDVDVFRFVLEGSPPSDLWQVEIITHGEVDTVARLYDRSGHRIAKGEGAFFESGLHMIETLQPGVYFVRIEGRFRGQGTYGLRVEATAW